MKVVLSLLLIAVLLVGCAAGRSASESIAAAAPSVESSAVTESSISPEIPEAASESAESSQTTAAPTDTTEPSEIPSEEDIEMNRFYIEIGDHTLSVVTEDNDSARALLELLDNGPLTIPASNFGGFEKVCPLGTWLPSYDVDTTTHAGDVMLYSSSQIVIFYGSNSWAYTRLGWVENASAEELRTALSGSDSQITLHR